ncbi:GDP-mannose 4,6-dehydratase [Geothrix limicola]|uniref:GDP-mannose 4,6-dehydratase n=1 Tax=Geothrix limicola TaxID=2927978 RepID=A0ABQ5QDI9_9BACT|nr:GDP-mannose 4,6-dehydratase [Geothrix limicola]GLH72510.1 GDP-mannose 4,6-dehydratase [Geothrix limicola]
MSQQVALITGITGQDGSYLAEFLLSKGYDVHGVVRRASNFNTERIDHIYVDPHQKGCLHLHYGDLTDSGALRNMLEEVRPTEIYNLGAQSHVRVSFDQPEYTVDVVGMGVIRLLEAVRGHQKHNDRQIRLYQAGSSEMFGSAKPRQHELTRFEPRSPYACAKAYAHYQVVNHRESYGLFATNGILFNHESPRRGETFVTRKITRAATRIKMGLQDKVYLGNLDAKRDWGFAGDYVEAMWLMLQQDQPDDYVIATGTSISIRDFLKLVFEQLDLDWEKHVEIDPRYFRPAEVDHLEGDPSKASRLMGWQPKTSITELAKMMVDSDLRLAEKELVLKHAGHEDAPRGGYR